MGRVMLFTPFTGDMEKNAEYADKCIRDSLSKGESPLSSRLLFGKIGIKAGLLWIKGAELVVIYEDLGISKCMELGIERARIEGCPFTYRRIL